MQGSWRSDGMGAAEFTSFDISTGVVTFRDGERTLTWPVERFTSRYRLV